MKQITGLSLTEFRKISSFCKQYLENESEQLPVLNKRSHRLDDPFKTLTSSISRFSHFCHSQEKRLY